MSKDQTSTIYVVMDNDDLIVGYANKEMAETHKVALRYTHVEPIAVRGTVPLDVLELFRKREFMESVISGELSLRAWHVLKAIPDPQVVTLRDLMRMKNCGVKTVCEIVRAYKRAGFPMASGDLPRLWPFRRQHFIDEISPNLSSLSPYTQKLLAGRRASVHNGTDATPVHLPPAP